jgi:hypothetical protein
LSYSEVSTVQALIEERSLFPDYQRLKISTTGDKKYNFVILDETVDRAKELIEARLEKK